MPSSNLRNKVLPAARRLVVKLGTSLLTGRDGRLDTAYLHDLARQVQALRDAGREVTIVSSGAVGSGLAELGVARRPADLAALQAVAAVGQPRLMGRFAEAFADHQTHVAQMLLTRGDFDDRLRFLNLRNCLEQLHALGCVPIINENDAVAVDELRFGDNDQLASLVANALRADVLVLLTVVDGLLDGQGRVVDLIENLDDARLHARLEERSALGTGGMDSKLQAAHRVAHAGEVAVIANGRTPNVLGRLFAGEAGIGTVFMPHPRKLDSRRRWIGMTRRPAGRLTLDPGAVQAVIHRGKSLLATGVTSVTGDFERGDVLSLCDASGMERARGLTNYSAADLARIAGHRTSDFEGILGRPSDDEVIHRDHLVVLADGPAA